MVPEVIMKSRTVCILKCTCKSEQQDKMYKGMRVANMMATKNPKESARQVRCTVCSSVHRTEDHKLV